MESRTCWAGAGPAAARVSAATAARRSIASSLESEKPAVTHAGAPAPRPGRVSPTVTGERPLDRHLRQVRERLLHLLGGVVEVLELARGVGVVRRHVDVAVAGEVEEDDLLLALLLRLERLVDRAADGVRRLGRGDDELGARELDGRLEAGGLR